MSELVIPNQTTLATVPVEKPILTGTDDFQKLLVEKLCEPFNPNELNFIPKQIFKNEGQDGKPYFNAIAIPYLKAKQVEDRMDAVFGPANWEDTYQLLSDGSVICSLAARIGSEWVRKSDVGSPSAQEKSGDRLKAAFTDAMKRAGKKWGIGRYLAMMPRIYVACEVTNPAADREFKFRKFLTEPAAKVPVNLTPKGFKANPQPTPVVVNEPERNEPNKTEQKPATTQAQQNQASKPAVNLKPGFVPKAGQEFGDWMFAKDNEAVSNGVIKPGELVNYISSVASKNGLNDPFEKWNVNAVGQAFKDAVAFLETEEKKPGKLSARIEGYNSRILEKYPNSNANFGSYCREMAQKIGAEHSLKSLANVSLYNWPNNNEVRAWVALQGSEYVKAIKAESDKKNGMGNEK